MSDAFLNNILEATFRANPDYELVLFDRLPPEETRLLHCLQEDPAFYGILCPREHRELGFKSVCRDTALLYFTLQVAGRLPNYLTTIFGDQCNKAVAELVLDGILEIESSGTFVSGPQAYHLIHAAAVPPKAHGIIASRSIEALKYAQALSITDSQKLSARMYAYGRQPVSPRWKRRFPTVEAVAKYLGLHARDTISATLDQQWSQVPVSQPKDIWIIWNSRHEGRAQSRSEPTFKLYVSPTCDVMRDAFQATVEVISHLRAPTFKVGRDVYGLLRPDKLVIYFAAFEDLQEASDHLTRKLSGCPAHGVPFTAEIAADGLLSWGMDPPRNHPILDWQGPESWRLWVTNHLAMALLSAKAATPIGVEPFQFALDRLRLEGVDTESWTPELAMWVDTMSESTE